MRAVLQRVRRASVTVAGKVVGRIDRPGLVALLAVTHTDGAPEVATMARKIAELRILDGEASVSDAGAPVLVVSQFTLYGDTRKGRRPSWSAAAQVRSPSRWSTRWWGHCEPAGSRWPPGRSGRR